MGYISLVILLLMICRINTQECPPPERLEPHCMCQSFTGFVMINCQGVTVPEELYSPIKSTEGYNILALNIEGSSLQYLPSKLFENTNISKIRFDKSELLSLSDTESAFVGLEDHLEELRAKEAFYVTSWDWYQLRNLKRIDVIDLSDIIMYSLDDPLPQLDTLKAFGLSKGEISFVHHEAFKLLEKLELLVLKENAISVFKRSMLPMPAEYLKHIDLSNNNLDLFHADMFDEMPNLREVFLHNNQFATLTGAPFSTAFGQLLQLDLSGNEIKCDCRLRWLINHKVPTYFQGNCSEPQRLTGTSLQYLNFGDLWC